MAHAAPMAIANTGMLLPCSSSTDLVLSHPTPEECCSIWELTYPEWGDALTLPEYLEESVFLTSVPLAKDGGMTMWILVDRHLPPNKRPILCSCETFRKRSFVAKNGMLSEKIVHGVASVFCNPAYRRRGFASRMMSELAEVLRDWQTTAEDCAGSVVYSDIGKTFYATFGWYAFADNNVHVELYPQAAVTALETAELRTEDLEQLCKTDQELIRRQMKRESTEGRLQVMLVPDHDHMLWHHRKEEFVCEKLFGRKPTAKGAVAGVPGRRIWAIWTHRFYSNPAAASPDNTLYILRLVVEDQEPTENDLLGPKDSSTETRRSENLTSSLRAVLQRAQAEAAHWGLGKVCMWHPTPLVLDLIQQTGLLHRVVERTDEGIASLLWFDEGSGREDTVQWIGNEKYGWC